MKLKKISALFLAGAVGAAMLAGCGGSGSKDSSSAASSKSASTESKSESAAESTSESKAESSSSEAAASDVEYTKHTLAASIPLTGNMMQYGISYRNALEMAVEDFNAAGGLNGEDVVLQINDDTGDSKEAINIANKIISDDDVFAVVGSFGSTVSMACAPVYEEAQMPMISPNTSHPDFPSMGEYLVPISPIADIERTAAANMIYDEFGGKDMAILYQNTDLGVTGTQIMTEVYEELGGKVVTTETFTPQQTKDFTPLISKIKAANPEILYIDGEYNDLANLLIQIDQIGLDGVQIVGPGNAFKQEFLDIAGDKANGIILAGTTPVYLDSVMKEGSDYSEYLIDFTKRYNEKYPDVACDGFAASAYDAAMLAMYAAKEVGTTDSKALVEAMLAIPEGFQVASGKDMYYKDYNYVVKNVFVYTVKDGQFEVYER